MKDRYLFKAKRVDNGEWVIGNLIYGSDGKIYIVCSADKESLDNENTDLLVTEWYEVFGKTICQCTGLKDKNGKLIWENDILSGHIDDSFPENETRKHVLWNENGWHTKEIESIDYEKLDNFDSENFEVIGNRFDNPKLLESEE